jgi:hypothetical protein
MVDTLSNDASAALNLAMISEFAERTIPCGVVVDGRGHTWRSLASFVQGAGPADLQSVLRQLNAIEDDLARSDRLAAAQRREDEDRAELAGRQTAQEEAAALVDVVEATRIALDANTVEARLGRVEAVLERIATSLEKR